MNQLLKPKWKDVPIFRKQSCYL